MNTTKIKKDEPIFHPSRTNAIVGVIAIVVMSGIVIYLLRSFVLFSTFRAFVVLTLLFLFMSFSIWMIIMTYFQSWVEFREDGMLLIKGGSRLLIPYDAMTHFLVTGTDKTRRAGIKLTRKIEPKTQGMAEKIFFGRGTHYVSLEIYTRVPKDGFSNRVDMEAFKATALGEALYQYAPHLFEVRDKHA